MLTYEHILTAVQSLRKQKIPIEIPFLLPELEKLTGEEVSEEAVISIANEKARIFLSLVGEAIKNCLDGLLPIFKEMEHLFLSRYQSKPHRRIGKYRYES